MSRNTSFTAVALLAGLTIVGGAVLAQAPAGAGGARGAAPAGPGGPGGRGGRGGGSPFGNFELKIDQVEDGLYMIRSSASGNITAFVSDEAVLLVDTKLTNESARSIELLRTVTDLPIQYVVNTHLHADHTGGNIAFEALGANIVATGNAARRMAETQTEGLPRTTFDDQMRINFGGRILDLYWFGRGHTDGDLVIHLPEERLVLTGDLFAGGNGEQLVRLIDYNAGGSLAEWSGTLEKVLALDFDRVIPGHSEVTDRAGLQAYLDQIVQMQDLISEMNEAGRAPQEIQQAVSGEFGQMAFIVLPGIQPVLDELE